jgi:hypothetical protein
MITRIKKGNAWVGILILLTFIASLSAALVLESVNTINQSKRSAQVLSAQALCDAGIEKTIWELNNDSGYIGEENFQLPTGEIDISVSGDFENKTALVTAYIPNEVNAKTTRTVRATFTAENNESGFSFHYGIQVGESGIDMSNNAKVAGNVYSGGSISAGNGATVFGDVYISDPSGVIDNLDIGCVESDDDDLGPNGTDLGMCPTDGDARAHYITKSYIMGDAYYQNISSTTVLGNSYPNTPPPDPVDLPISDLTIEQWKSWAEDGGTYEGNYVLSGNGVTADLGPIKINGDMVITNNSTLTMTGVIYVTGDIDFDNNATIKLDSSFGANSGMIIADGPIDTSNNVTIQGSGDPNSYVMALSNDPGTAIVVSNNSDAVVYYAGNGTIDVSNNARIRSLSAKMIKLSNGAEVIYETGLANANFSAGPGGSWRVKEWQVIH